MGAKGTLRGGDINKALEKLQLYKSINRAKVVSVPHIAHQICIFYDKNANFIL